MAVKCLTEHQKKYIIFFYQKKNYQLKQLAEQFDVSPRTINRVLIEAGIATPVARIKGEAYHVMQLLKKHGLDRQSLEAMLEKVTSQETVNAA